MSDFADACPHCVDLDAEPDLITPNGPGVDCDYHCDAGHTWTTWWRTEQPDLPPKEAL